MNITLKNAGANLVYLAAKHYTEGKAGLAIAALLELFRGNYPDDERAAAINNAGQICEQLGKPDLALQCYAEALALLPNSCHILSNYGQLLRDYGRFDDCEQMQRKALEEKPESDLARFRLSVILLLLGDFYHGWELYEARLGLREQQPVSLLCDSIAPELGR